MTTNTNRHLSDMASSVLLVRDGTVWENDPTIQNLQDVLESFSELSVRDVKATDAKFGVVKLAKDADITSGVGSDDVITSKQLLLFNGKPLASYDLYGTTKYSNETETLSGKSEETAINPKQLSAKFNKTPSSTTTLGTIKLSSESMVIPGTNNNTAMTPKLVKLAIDRLVPGVATATETATGTVILANIQTTLAGVVREGYAVSPYSFSKANATYDEYGTVRYATLSEVVSTNEKLAINPKTLLSLKSTNDKEGLVSLATEEEVKGKTNNTKAVTPRSIAYLLNKIDELENVIKESPKGGMIPIGGTFYSFALPEQNGNFMLVDGSVLLVSEYQELFKLIGYTYGGSGNTFNLPDKRGLYSRMVGKGKNIIGDLSDIDVPEIGETQRQQVLAHKHVSPFSENRAVGMAKFGSCNTRGLGLSTRHDDYDNVLHWTNDGTYYDGNPNPQGQIGNENRPWTMGMYELIRVK